MKEDNYTPEQAIKEQLQLLVKAGRRCAYDLHHAADLMPEDDTFTPIMRNRATHWLTIFNSADDGKNYRHHLHNKIDRLENEVERLKKLCEKHGISQIDIMSDIPF